jgi:hypothetical protein
VGSIGIRIFKLSFRTCLGAKNVEVIPTREWEEIRKDKKLDI